MKTPLFLQVEMEHLPNITCMFCFKVGLVLIIKVAQLNYWEMGK